MHCCASASAALALAVSVVPPCTTSLHLLNPVAVVLVGDHEPSKVYVAAKEHACAEVGIMTRRLALPGDASVADVANAVATLNDDPRVDGVLLQVISGYVFVY